MGGWVGWVGWEHAQGDHGSSFKPLPGREHRRAKPYGSYRKLPVIDSLDWLLETFMRETMRFLPVGNLVLANEPGSFPEHLGPQRLSRDTRVELGEL